MSSGSARQAVIIKLWSQGATRKLIRERLHCGGAAIDEALGALARTGGGGAEAGPVRAGSGWSPARIERARAMWLAGESAAVIGKALGVTRNAVIGKLARLGVARPDAVSRANREAGARKGAGVSATARAKAPARPVLKVVANAARPRPSEPEPEPLASLMRLTSHMCRWPIGEPEQAGFGFCGRPAQRSFCPDHARRAYLAEPLEPIERLAGLERRPDRRFPGGERRR
jgi:GcrA cell cycle regulator